MDHLDTILEQHPGLTHSDRRMINADFLRSIRSLEMPEYWDDEDSPEAQLINQHGGVRQEVQAYWKTLREATFNHLK
tara:strand:+ start:242 stop:472 length:231 start_codon:yes stop_codon:yes gene_type:complete